MADTFDHGSRPTLWERLGALSGHTTYREPVGGRTSRHNAIPADHELCIALGWARRRDDPTDIGPDIAFDIATGTERHKHTVLPILANAISADDGRYQRIIRRNRPFMAIIVADAYLRAIHGNGYPMPEAMRADDWDILTDAAYRVLTTMAENAVQRAASRLRKGG